MKKIIIVLFVVPVISLAQTTRQDSLWLPFKTLIGKWSGSGEGEPGKGRYQTSFEFIFNNKFIEIKNITTWLPTDKKPKGEVHEDRSYISYDKGRKTFILRQFHIEGFVNEYVLESISPDGKTIVFVTEAIENIPTGWRARETYQVLDANHWKQAFDLAEPGKEFSAYTKAEFVKTN